VARLASTSKGNYDDQLHFGGPQGVVSICPINDQHCYLYCIHKASIGEWRDPATLHKQLRGKLEGYGGLIPDLAAQLDDPSLVAYRPLEWMLVPSPWYRRRVVLIGHAAHATPNVAQGAAMGIKDAIVLADEVSSSVRVEDSLARFMARRWDRVKLVVEVSCSVAKNRVEHIPGFDAAAEIRRASTALAEHY
jgi:2-polyprenyl-6-methoxyphenol hydroxylase-like FAD-dependent oxidoreductase